MVVYQISKTRTFAKSWIIDKTTVDIRSKSWVIVRHLLPTLKCFFAFYSVTIACLWKFKSGCQQHSTRWFWKSFLALDGFACHFVIYETFYDAGEMLSRLARKSVEMFKLHFWNSRELLIIWGEGWKARACQQEKWSWKRHPWDASEVEKSSKKLWKWCKCSITKTTASVAKHYGNMTAKN